jgi:glycosyltransferase involved in cell wall biosynthesis
MFSAWRRPSRTSDALRGGRVSVVVPLFNHASYVVGAVQSALDQGRLLHEVVVVDDGSTDGSAETLARSFGDDPRLVLWSQPNRGAHAAINAGLLRATGEVLAILNSDDAYEPGRLDRLVAALDADPGAALAGSGLRFVGADGEPVPNPWYDEALGFLQETGDLLPALVNGNFLMTTSNFVFRRSLLDRIGLFAPLRYAHDLDFLLRALVHGERFALLLEEQLLSYRIHSANTIKEDHASVRCEWAAVSAAALDGLAAAGGQVDWPRMRAVTSVLERHALLPAVQLCLAHLRRHPASSLERAALLSDTSFLATLRAAV